MQSIHSSVTAYIGVGSNLGDTKAQVVNAISQLATLPHTTLSAQSSLFRTAPIDSSGNNYINAVVRLNTQLSPPALLRALQNIEHHFSRERPYLNAPRTLDLDLLLYGMITLVHAALTVPHPRMVDRAFVLIPLLQIDPFITIPGHGAAHQFVQQVADQTITKI
ncbi:MAG: 2-amino-4-hydroxy-6-hydroxymethyldihydropteridine diphosphokinase [Glaciimonas sp.]|nr:2-amino-4-hydroxy-6-hydroxymethyldihydropteridine diphosphokinase [Glaciimonas sp.]